MLLWQRENQLKAAFLALGGYNLKTNSVIPIFYCWFIIRMSRLNVPQSLKNVGIQYHLNF